jgi:L-seryl-tRNA(Ser) seleniumtransferase
MPGTRSTTAGSRPPSVDRLARSIAGSGLPHPLCVHVARQAIAAGDPDAAAGMAAELGRLLLTDVVNATGVLLHTNLGRAPVGLSRRAHAQNLELDLTTGGRGSRQRGIGILIAQLCGAEAAMVVNNNAAAVLLVTAALAAGRDVLVSRGESVEIGGGFRVPEVIEQSGGRLVDVGTTNRTRLADYRRALGRSGLDVAMVLKVHPSNYRVDGFTESTTVEQLATLGTPVVADIGSGLVDAACPWLSGPPPAWLAEEPAARQVLAAGADLVTFSGDKLMGGPQAGIIAGRAELVARCAQHPLARALRPGGLVLAALQETVLAHLDRTAATTIPFWAMASVGVDELRRRAEAIATIHPAAAAVPTEALPGAGSAPGRTLPSFGIRLPGDHLAALRACTPPIIARTSEGATVLDLRTVDRGDDVHLSAAIGGL